ncbi:MAG: DUF4191 domain-containing protein [Kineosporiaceae bacterium]|nr:DUF4191 domain-containing protein [Aeromicrobium sp.]
MSTPVSEPPKGRLRQIRQAYKITKRSDKNIGLILLLWFLVVGGIFAAVGYFVFGRGTLGIITAVVFGLLTGLLAAMIIFGRRAERAAYAQVEGQVGAAAGALQMLKRGWDLKPAVAFTKNQDVVHRLLGRPGIILVGEGNPNRVRNLLATEKKKHARIAGEVPIIGIIVGDGADEVRLTKLVKHVRKLPKKIKPREMTGLISKLRALDAMRPAAPMPHGPMPTSMKGSRKAMRG